MKLTEKIAHRAKTFDTANEAKKLRVSQGLKATLSPVERFNREQTRKHAIHAHCYTCCGEDADSGWKWGIGSCPVAKCTLWRFQPYQQLYNTPAKGVYRLERDA
jgi:hypothetical protein